MNFSSFSQELLANWIRGNVFSAVPVGLEMALSTGDPLDDGSGLVEPPAIDGYARQSVTFTAPVSVVVSGTSVTNVAAVVFGPAVGNPWPAVTHGAIFDTGTGDMLWHGSINIPRTAQVGDSIAFAIGDLQPTITRALSHYAGEAYMNWMNGAATVPPVALEAALSLADPLGDNSGLLEPLLINGYARQPVVFNAPVTVVGVGSTIVEPLSMIFGTATGANWGAITDVAIIDTGGNLMLFGSFSASTQIDIGDSGVTGPGAITAVVR